MILVAAVRCGADSISSVTLLISTQQLSIRLAQESDLEAITQVCNIEILVSTCVHFIQPLGTSDTVIEEPSWTNCKKKFTHA